jgi:hypothetical protein
LRMQQGDARACRVRRISEGSAWFSEPLGARVTRLPVCVAGAPAACEARRGGAVGGRARRGWSCSLARVRSPAGSPVCVLRLVLVAAFCRHTRKARLRTTRHNSTPRERAVCPASWLWLSVADSCHVMSRVVRARVRNQHGKRGCGSWRSIEHHAACSCAPPHPFARARARFVLGCPVVPRNAARARACTRTRACMHVRCQVLTAYEARWAGR